MVSSRGDEVVRVWGELAAQAVLLVCEDLVLGVELGGLLGSAARERPDVAVPLVVDGRHVETLGIYGDTLYRDIGLRDELLGLVRLKVPDMNDARLVSDYKFLQNRIIS